MKVVVLGTGAADGLPQPFCRCRTCQDARAQGLVRCPGGVLIDQVLLIDAPPGLGAAVARAGVDLTEVRTIAVTHAHSDHWDPSILLHRAWLAPTVPLRLIGPPSVLRTARAWLAPDHDVELLVAQPGAGFDLDGHFLRALPSTHGKSGDGAVDPWAAEAVLYEVLSDDAALLYGADTGPPDEVMLAAVAEAQYDVALLELTFGSPDGPTSAGHLDHRTFPAALRSLREVGAIGTATDVVAFHLGHHNPASAELEATLSAWGARTVPDGTALEYRGASEGAPTTAHTVLITGGARSGKSAFAEARAAASMGPVTYLATGARTAGDDPEWDARVAAHQARRPAHWTTIESADPAAELGRAAAGATVIVDCLGAWLTSLIDAAGAWDDLDRARSVVLAATAALRSALASTPAALVLIVTNEVGSGVVPPFASGRTFRDLLGQVNATIGAVSDEVVLVVAGRPVPLPAATAPMPDKGQP